jgi:hypothetical protein
MEKQITLFGLGLLLCLPTSVNAKLGGAQTAPPSEQNLTAEPPRAVEPVDSPSTVRPWLSRLSFSAGPAFIIGSKSMGAATLNLRSRLGNEDSSWSVEVGGNWPATVSTNFRRVQQTINGNTYDARIDSLSEIHISAHYEIQHGQQDIIIPEVGLGVSMLKIENEINVAMPTAFARSESSETSWSPLVRLGLRFFPKKRVSFLLDLAYVYYSNKPSFGPEFDLPVEGLMIRPMIQVRF